MPIVRAIAEGVGPFDKLDLDLSDGKGNPHLGPHILAGHLGDHIDLRHTSRLLRDATSHLLLLALEVRRLIRNADFYDERNGRDDLN